MIDAAQIKILAAGAKIDPGIVEKDHVLSKALMALSRDKEFQEAFVFKGGTALMKCYYPQWRFSEDIDLTAKAKLKSKEIQLEMKRTNDLKEKESKNLSRQGIQE